MDRQRVRVLRARLEPLAQGYIRDSNEAIKTLAGVLLELTESPHEDAVAEMSERQFRERVDEVRRQAGERGVGRMQLEQDKGDPPLDSRALGDEALKRGAEHVPTPHGAQGEQVRREVLEDQTADAARERR